MPYSHAKSGAKYRIGQSNLMAFEMKKIKQRKGAVHGQIHAHIQNNRYQVFTGGKASGAWH
jgi:hypothetical protein